VSYLSPGAGGRPAVWGSRGRSCPTCPVRPRGGPSRPPASSTTAVTGNQLIMGKQLDNKIISWAKRLLADSEVISLTMR